MLVNPSFNYNCTILGATGAVRPSAAAGVMPGKTLQQ